MSAATKWTDDSGFTLVSLSALSHIHLSSKTRCFINTYACIVCTYIRSAICVPRNTFTHTELNTLAQHLNNLPLLLLLLLQNCIAPRVSIETPIHDSWGKNWRQCIFPLAWIRLDVTPVEVLACCGFNSTDREHHMYVFSYIEWTLAAWHIWMNQCCRRVFILGSALAFKCRRVLSCKWKSRWWKFPIMPAICPVPQ